MVQLVNEVRLNPLNSDIAVISTVRRLRPKEHQSPRGFRCPFCPGNEELTPPATAVLVVENGRRKVLRDSDGERVRGWKARIFPNKYPALTTSPPRPHARGAEPAYGYHEVAVETPKHVPDPHNVDLHDYADALWLVFHRVSTILMDPRVEYVAVIKNRGSRAGASIMHTHLQIFGLPFTPPRVAREVEAFKAGCPLCSIADEHPELIVAELDDFLVTVNPAPRAPYEVWIIPRRHEPTPLGLDDKRLIELSKAVRMATKAYVEGLGYDSYNAWIHMAPRGVTGYHWHVEFMPVSVTWGGLEKSCEVYIVEVPPEEAAERLRSLLASHNT